MRTIAAGTATKEGLQGVDAYLKYTGNLPANYISKTTADNNGWVRKKGNLGDIFPGKSIGGDVYDNRNHKLPEKQGRIWYEADFDYYGGYRNDSRILYSSDGLIFVTYDHYKTFYEVY